MKEKNIKKDKNRRFEKRYNDKKSEQTQRLH